MTISRGLDGIQQLCVELAAIIHANFHVAASVRSSGERSLSLYTDFRDHHHDTVKARAIELAVNFRIFDEGGEESPAYVNLKREIERALSPGVLVGPEETPLSLRDCANKIIHARDFQFERIRFKTEDPRTGDTFSNETKDSSIKVFGEQSGRPWECRIDLLRLSEALHELVDRWVGGQFERM